MNGIQLTMEKVVLLYLCDERAPLPTAEMLTAGATISANSVVALPQKRDLLRRSAREHEVQIEGEVIIELDRNSDMEDVLNSTMEKIEKYEINSVISLDCEGLVEAGLFRALINRLEGKGLEFINVQ